MKIEWVPLSRRPDWPWWAFALTALWLALGAANVLLARALDEPVQLCIFKRFTGCPCPTCGFARGVLSFLAGHPIRGWLYNPLLFSFLGACGAVVLTHVFLGLGIRVRLTRHERQVAWIIGAALFAANWLYVIRYIG